METKRLSFSIDSSANQSATSGVSSDTPGSNIYPVAQVPTEAEVVARPQSEVVAKPKRSLHSPGDPVSSGATPVRPSTLPPPPPGLFLRRADSLPPPLLTPPPSALRPSGVITQLEVAPRLPRAPLPPLPAPPLLPREARASFVPATAPAVEPPAATEEPPAEPRSTDFSSGAPVRPSTIVLRDGVRRADVRDAEVLAAIQVMAREHAFERSLLPRPTELDFDQLVRDWRFRASTASRARTFLALRSGEPAGFVSAGPGRAGYGWEGEIYSAHVHPRFWGTRVAENLAAAAFDHLVQRGFSVVRFWVTVNNIEVLSRLSALGFRPVAQRFHPQHGGLQEAFVRRLD